MAVDSLGFDAATGVWVAAKTSGLSGQYYKFIVDVFVRGVGLVRNGVTDPYSISLTTDSKRSYIADLAAANLVGARPRGAGLLVQHPVNSFNYQIRDRD